MSPALWLTSLIGLGAVIAIALYAHAMMQKVTMFLTVV